MKCDNIKKKIEKENKAKDKEGSTGQSNVLMEATKPGKKRKKWAGDPEWYRESKGIHV